MSSTIGIKISSTESLAKVVSIVRKYEPLSISEIKKRVDNNSYILTYRYTDDKGLNTILKCHTDFYAAGISAQLFEHDRPCDIQFFKNLSNTYQEISDDIDDENAENDEE